MRSPPAEAPRTPAASRTSRGSRHGCARSSREACGWPARVRCGADRARRSSHCGRPSVPRTSRLPGRSPGARGRTETSRLVVRKVGQCFFQDVAFFGDTRQLLLELGDLLLLGRALSGTGEDFGGLPLLELVLPALQQATRDAEALRDLGGGATFTKQCDGIPLELRSERSANSGHEAPRCGSSETL